jgi:hypothetical protein
MWSDLRIRGAEAQVSESVRRRIGETGNQAAAGRGQPNVKPRNREAEIR